MPHYLNKIENANYVGPLPSADMCGCDDMTEADRERFFEWYTTLSQDQKYVFYFRAELVKYCLEDVRILRLACLKFREGFIAENNVDPFRQAVTITGACMTTYRTNHLPATHLHYSLRWIPSCRPPVTRYDMLANVGSPQPQHRHSAR